MNTILTTAIVGTGQTKQKDLTTQTPVDTLANQLTTHTTERSLLLTAGALAIYKEAGTLAPTATAEQVAPAAPETIPPCPTQHALLLDTLLQGTNADFLPEVLGRMHKRQWRIPHELLPAALAIGYRNTKYRASIAAVSGERGYWLAQFQANWRWITDILADTSENMPENAEEIWQEGTLKQREEVLRRLRQLNPIQAREWVQAVWKQEKAEARAAFLKILADKLSQDEYEFIEQALTDRAEGVRAIAAELITHFPHSPHVQQVMQFIDTTIAYKDEKFRVSLPNELTKELADVVHIAKNQTIPQTKSEWIRRAIQNIPAQYWEKRFSMTPTEFVALLNYKREWDQTIALGIAQSAMRHNNYAWIQALIGWYNLSILEKHSHDYVYAQLLSHLSSEDAEQAILPLLEAFEHRSITLISYFSHAWSQKFSEAVIALLKEGAKQSHVHKITPEEVFTHTAVALHPACFHLVSGEWEFPDKKEWYVSYWRNYVDTLQARIHVRKHLLEEF